MGSEGSKPIPFNQMSKAELQRVRRRSLSDNNLTAARSSAAARPKFRRTLSLKKRKKWVTFRQMVPADVPAHSLGGTVTQGYVQKCHKGEDWERVWCVLRSGMLYVYEAASDDVALDSVDLSLCSFKQYTEGYKHHQHVVEIRQEPYTPEFIAMETQEEMAEWLDHLKAGVLEMSVGTVTPAKSSVTMTVDPDTSQVSTNMESSVVPSSDWEMYHNQDDDAFLTRAEQGECFDDTGNTPTSPESDQKVLILQKKQELLQEVLLHKQQLQTNKDKNSCKDVEDELNRYQQQYSPLSDSSPRSPDITMATTLSPLQNNHEDERQWKELIMLKQRKMSAELKVDSLQRIIHSCNTKPQKKARLRLPLMKKSGSQENLCAPDTPAPEEINHWILQLQTLKNELEELTGEIQAREQRHTWYSGIRTACDDGKAEPRSLSLLSERGLLRHGLGTTDRRKQSSSSTKSDGCIDEDRPTRRSDGYRPRVDSKVRLYAQNSNSSVGTGTDSKRVLQAQNSNSSVGAGSDSKRPLCGQFSNSSVTTTSSWSSTQNTDCNSPVLPAKQPNTRPARFTALGKKLPTTKRGMMQKSRSQDQEDAGSPGPNTLNDRRSSYDVGQRTTAKKEYKRASLDERIVIGGTFRTPTISRKIMEETPVNETPNFHLDREAFQTVPPNSRRSSEGSDLPSGVHFPENMPSPSSPEYDRADSLLTSVMQALDTINKTPPQGEGNSSSSDWPCSQNSTPGLRSSLDSTPGLRASVDSPVFMNNTSSVFSPRSDHSACTCVSVLTEKNLDTDSGRGSPLTPDIPFSADRTSPRSVNQAEAVPRPRVGSGGQRACEHDSRIYSPASGQQGSNSPAEDSRNSQHDEGSPQSSTGSISTRALANISAFEQLIHEKLGYY